MADDKQPDYGFFTNSLGAPGAGQPVAGQQPDAVDEALAAAHRGMHMSPKQLAEFLFDRFLAVGTFEPHSDSHGALAIRIEDLVELGAFDPQKMGKAMLMLGNAIYTELSPINKLYENTEIFIAGDFSELRLCFDEDFDTDDEIKQTLTNHQDAIKEAIGFAANLNRNDLVGVSNVRN